MSNYIIARNGELKRCDNTLSHANGWKKQNAKYIKRIPKPGGGFTYIYEQTGLKTRNDLNNVRGDFKDSLIKNRGFEGVRENKQAGTYVQRQQNKYNQTAAGKIEKAAKNAVSKTKNAINTGVSKAKEAKVQYDEQQKKKKLDRALTELSPIYRTGKAVVNKHKEIKSDFAKAAKRNEKKLKEYIDKGKNIINNPVDALDKAAKKKKSKKVKKKAEELIDRTVNTAKGLGALGITKVTGKDVNYNMRDPNSDAVYKMKTKKKRNGKVKIQTRSWK